MFGTCASRALAIACRRRFFSSVKSCARRGAAARARSSFSRVVTEGLTLVAISTTGFLSGEICADLLCNRPLDGVGMASVDDGDVHPRSARAPGSAEFRAHASGAELALAVAQVLHGRSELAHRAHELGRFAAVGDVE